MTEVIFNNEFYLLTRLTSENTCLDLDAFGYKFMTEVIFNNEFYLLTK